MCLVSYAIAVLFYPFANLSNQLNHSDTNQLTGTVHTELVLLSSLTSLDLGANSLSGALVNQHSKCVVPTTGTCETCGLFVTHNHCCNRRTLMV